MQRNRSRSDVSYRRDDFDRALKHRPELDDAIRAAMDALKSGQ